MSTLRRFGFLLSVLFLLGAVRAHAGVADAPPENLEVSLITYGPGDIYWERFGHDAIELRDRASGEAVSFNYGLFDFDESGFLLNFARGRMRYLMGADASDEDQSYYVESGRSVSRQRLAFSPAQADALRGFLAWNLRPENRRYGYDYYVSNCATRVRDALDQALGGAIRRDLVRWPGGETYRQQTARLMSNQAWLMLILDLGLGPYADQPLNAWQESFLPMVLQQEVRKIRLDGDRPLVEQETLIAPNRLPVPPAAAPDLRWPLTLAGLVFAAALLLACRYAPPLYAVLGSLYLLLAGIVGLLMIVLWAFTLHRSAWANANLLLFNPLAWLLVPSVWRARRGLAVAGLPRFVLALQALALALIVAGMLHLFPGVVQQNQPWLLFALLCWLAMAHSLRRGMRRVGVV